MNWLKNLIWRKKIQFRFNRINKKYNSRLTMFHPIEQDAIRTARNSFHFFFHRKSWTRNINRIVKELEIIETQVNHRTKGTSWNW
jgi:uncharacterized protein (DUF2252 family)